MLYRFSIINEAFSTADLPQPHTSTRMQEMCMRNFIEPDDAFFRRKLSAVHTHFFQNEGTRTDSCTWAGIECTDGVVESILVDLNNSGKSVFGVDLEWVPPTTAFITLSGLWLLKDWRVAHFPRNLRFLYMNRCTSNRAPSSHLAPVNFQDLPSQMEELYILRSWKVGVTKVYIEALPRTMRVLHITAGIYFLETAYISFEELPTGLQCICCANRGTMPEARIKGTGKLKADPRASSTANMDAWKSTAYPSMIPL